MEDRTPVAVAQGAVQDRREFLATFGGSVGAALLACAWRDADGGGGARLGPIGLQLYTVRSEMQKDVEATLARVAEIGYQEVEFAGYFGKRPAELRSLLEKYHLRAPSAHVPFESTGAAWAATLDAAKVVGHEYLVVPWLPAVNRGTLDDYQRVADRLNHAAAQAKEAGVRFAYHNHDFEFAPLEGRLPYDVLLQATDPTLVAMELDLYWIIKGGQDPSAYFARTPGRFAMVHVKDSAGPPAHRMVDVGRGIIDFKGILAHRAQAGIHHFFVEHDEPPDPFASARASFAYLSRLEV